MTLTQEQASEMVNQIRAERMAGRPEIAAAIKQALDNGEYYGDIVAPEERAVLKSPPTHGPGSGKKEWDKFALAESDLDEEIILDSTKSDLIVMLKAYGVIE